MIYHWKSTIVLCRIRLFPTMISKMKWVWYKLPLNQYKLRISAWHTFVIVSSAQTFIFSPKNSISSHFDGVRLSFVSAFILKGPSKLTSSFGSLKLAKLCFRYANKTGNDLLFFKYLFKNQCWGQQFRSHTHHNSYIHTLEKLVKIDSFIMDSPTVHWILHMDHIVWTMDSRTTSRDFGIGPRFSNFCLSWSSSVRGFLRDRSVSVRESLVWTI